MLPDARPTTCYFWLAVMSAFEEAASLAPPLHVTWFEYSSYGTSLVAFGSRHLPDEPSVSDP